MTAEEAREKPLNELLAYLTLLYEDCDCTCDCMPDVWFKSKEKKEKCISNGRWFDCPQRIAYDRIMEAVGFKEADNDEL